MISQISLIALIAVLATLIGLFIVIKSFKLPASFNENREKREEYRRVMIKIREKEKAREMAMGREAEETEENAKTPEIAMGRQPPKSREAPQ